jgi:hypothetical protein
LPFAAVEKKLAIYFLVMALRINWNTARYQKMSDMSVGLFVMGTLLAPLGAKRMAELSDGLGNSRQAAV